MIGSFAPGLIFVVVVKSAIPETLPKELFFLCSTSIHVVWGFLSLCGWHTLLETTICVSGPKWFFCTKAVQISCCSGFFGNLFVLMIKTQRLGVKKEEEVCPKRKSCTVQCSLYCHLSGNFFVTILLALVPMSSSVVLSLMHKKHMKSSLIKQSLLSYLFSLLII